MPTLEVQILVNVIALLVLSGALSLLVDQEFPVQISKDDIWYSLIVLTDNSSSRAAAGTRGRRTDELLASETLISTHISTIN